MDTFRHQPPGSILGVAFEETCIRFIQTSRSHGAGGAVCCGVAEVEPIRTEGAGLWAVRAGERLRQAMSAAGITATSAVAALPLRQLTFQTISMAPMPAAAMAEAVRWQAAQVLAQRPEDLCTDFHSISVGGVPSGQATVMAVSIASQDVERAVGALRHAGLEVRAIDAWPYVIARCLDPLDPRTGTPASCLIVGLCGPVRIVCLLRSRDVWFIRCVIGRAEELRSQPEESCISAPEVVAHEVALIAHHLAETLPDGTVPTIGGIIGAGEHEAEYLESLRSAVAIPFLRCADLISAPCRSALRSCISLSDADRWLPSLGLSLYEGDSAGVAA